MKLPERLARRKGRGFHSAIVTSFAVEFAAFEEVMLPQLGAGGSSNVLLIADARMTAMSLSDGSNLPMQLGRDYVLFSPPVGDGVFHPKIVLQLGRDAGRCFVTSANATGAGLGGNVEIAVEVECGSEPSAEREIVRAAWRYLERLVPSDAGAARDAMNWARERAQWLDGRRRDQRLDRPPDVAPHGWYANLQLCPLVEKRGPLSGKPRSVPRRARQGLRPNWINPTALIRICIWRVSRRSVYRKADL